MRVIVDDAHFAPERLDRLRQLRTQLRAPFKVVATSWPDWEPDVAPRLGATEVFELPLLTREEMLEVIESLGVRGTVELQAKIIRQARGRPGPAATLVQACLAGHVRDVVVGDRLLSDVALSVDSLTGAHQGIMLLGLLGLADEQGLSVEEVSRVTGLPLLQVTQLLAGAASGGVIERGQRSTAEEPTFIAQPAAVRYAAVHQTFFAPGPGLPLRPAIDALPGPSRAAMPLVQAAHRGGAIGRDLLRRVIVMASNAPALASYAALGDDEAEFAVSISTGEAKGRVAEAALGQSPAIAITALLELSVGDDRPRHSFPDHGQRRLEDFALAPEPTSQRRRLVLDVARSWLNEGGDASVAIEAMATALKPMVDWSQSNATGSSLTIHRGLVPLAVLRDSPSGGRS